MIKKRDQTKGYRQIKKSKHDDCHFLHKQQEMTCARIMRETSLDTTATFCLLRPVFGTCWETAISL